MHFVPRFQNCYRFAYAACENAFFAGQTTMTLKINENIQLARHVPSGADSQSRYKATVFLAPPNANIVLFVHLIIIAFLFIANGVNIYITVSGIIDPIDFFDFNMEANLPTFFSTMILLEASFLMGIIAVSELPAQQKFFAPWFLGSLILFMMALDEAAQVHEKWQSFLSADAVLVFVLFVVAVFTVICVAYFYKFRLRFSFDIGKYFVIFGILFISGSIVLDNFNAHILKYVSGKTSVEYYIFLSIEEVFEMLGVTVLVFGLLKYLKKKSFEFSISRN